MNYAGPVLPEPLIFIRKSPKSKLTCVQVLIFKADNSTIIINNNRMGGDGKVSHPQVVSSTDRSLVDYYKMRVVCSPVSKGCWQVLGSIVKKVCVHLGSTFLCRNKGLLCRYFSCSGRLREFPTWVVQRAQTGWTLLCPEALGAHSSGSAYC